MRFGRFGVCCQPAGRQVWGLLFSAQVSDRAKGLDSLRFGRLNYTIEIIRRVGVEL